MREQENQTSWFAFSCGVISSGFGCAATYVSAKYGIESFGNEPDMLFMKDIHEAQRVFSVIGAAAGIAIAVAGFFIASEEIKQ